MLAHGGVARAATKFAYKPTTAGGGGALRLLWWQGPTLLNPHFAVGTKDQDGARLFYEPLAAWDPDGYLVPVLAAEIPSIENEGLAPDGTSVTWKLKRGVKWHDGHPFTADDVVFNWQYARDPATAATTVANYKDVTTEKIDDFTVRVRFAKPTPFWADAFVGTQGMLIPKHVFADYAVQNRVTHRRICGRWEVGPIVSSTSSQATWSGQNAIPTTTFSTQPHFDTVELKGGGDAVSAARAVIQTGEYDYAWNMQVEDEILLRLEQGRQGRRTHHAGRQHRTHTAQHHRSVERDRRGTIREQHQAPPAVGSWRQTGSRALGRPRRGARAHLRADRYCHG